MNIISRKRPTQVEDERGMAAILITMVMVTVITLLILGFTIVSRRENRQALDRQLSTQAFYAAESGVNDVRKVIADTLALGNPIEEKTSCQNNTPAYDKLDNASKLSGDDVKYTCVLVDPVPEELQKTVTDENSWIVPIETDVVPGGILFEWSPSVSSPGDVPSAQCNSETEYSFAPTTSRTCKYPVLRVDLVDTTTLQYVNTNSTMNNVLTTYYFQPKGDGSSTTARVGFDPSNGADAKAPIVKLVSSCDAGAYGKCKALIVGNYQGTGSPTPPLLKPLTQKMALRVTSLYGTSSVKVSACSNNSNPIGTACAKTGLKNAQVVIDATGKAQDVLRRIQVHIPVSDPESFAPNYALQGTGSICKRFNVYPGIFEIAGDINDELKNSDPLCRP